jgi:hypothetical protein
MTTGHGDDVVLSNTLTVNGLSTLANVSVSVVNITSNSLTLGLSNVQANNGYSRLPNGLLLQWGNALCNSTKGNVTFTVPFTTVYQGIVSGNSTTANTLPVVSSINTTVIVLRSANVGTGVSGSWLVIGV